MNYDGFCKLFSDTYPKATQVGERYYLVNEEVADFKSGEQRKPYATGLFLGMGPRAFVPSAALLTLLSKTSSRKATLNDEKAEWHFLCGKDIFPEFYTTDITAGLVLVQNKLGENLGLAKMEHDTKKGLLLKNVLDRGNYLRHDKVRMVC
jgi:ribosome biogenesis protein Nip4